MDNPPIDTTTTTTTKKTTTRKIPNKVRLLLQYRSEINPDTGKLHTLAESALKAGYKGKNPNTLASTACQALAKLKMSPSEALDAAGLPNVALADLVAQGAQAVDLKGRPDWRTRRYWAEMAAKARSWYGDSASAAGGATVQVGVLLAVQDGQGQIIDIKPDKGDES